MSEQPHEPDPVTDATSDAAPDSQSPSTADAQVDSVSGSDTPEPTAVDEAITLGEFEVPPTEEAEWLVDSAFEFPDKIGPPPGPGLWESAGWVLGFTVMQVHTAFAMMAVAFLIYLGQARGVDELQALLHDPGLLKTLYGQYSGLIIGGGQTLLTVAVIGAVVLRLEKRRRRLLPLGVVPWRHWVIIGAVWIPLAVLCGNLFVFANKWQMWLVDRFPQLSGLVEQSSMEAVQKMVGSMPIGVIFLAIAITPAIAEELVFRGIIGRGLVARWGLIAGVTITSLIFAAVHLNPAHAFSLIPLAVFLHISHIATRSIWAPIALHFLNNALAVMMMFAATQPEVQKQMADAPERGPLPWVIAASAAVVVVMLASLWRTRLRFYHPDGAEWDPGYVTAERPPAEFQGTGRAEKLGPWLLIASVVAVYAFLTAVYNAGAG